MNMGLGGNIKGLPDWLNATRKATLSPAMGVGAVLSTPVKLGLAFLGGAITSLLVGGAKQYLEQKTEQETQQAQKTTGGGFTFYTEPYGTVTLNSPQAGEASATQSATSKAQQDAAQTTPDYLQWLLIGGLAIAAIYVLKRKR